VRLSPRKSTTLVSRLRALFLTGILACKAAPPAASFRVPESEQFPASTKKDGDASRSTASSASSASILPKIAPPFLAAGPIEFGHGFIRRAYVFGRSRVEITIAAMGKEPGAFERGVAGSANYLQAPLGLPASEANGFYTCVSYSSPSACDLHVQLRSGFHVEAMGNGAVPRAELAELLTHIPLGDLSDSIFAER